VGHPSYEQHFLPNHGKISPSSIMTRGGSRDTKVLVSYVTTFRLSLPLLVFKDGLPTMIIIVNNNQATLGGYLIVRHNLRPALYSLFLNFSVMGVTILLDILSVIIPNFEGNWKNGRSICPLVVPCSGAAVRSDNMYPYVSNFMIITQL
jgi:hypothetical protein